MDLNISKIGAYADEFNEKAAESIKNAKESAVDKSVFEDKDKFVEYYAEQIEDLVDSSKKDGITLGNMLGGAAVGLVSTLISDKLVGTTEEVTDALSNNGLLDPENAETFNYLFDQKKDGNYSKDEIKEILGAAYDAYSQNINAE